MITKNEIKHIHELRLKKKRKEFNEFIVEGEKMVGELIANAPELIVKFFCTESFLQNYTINNIDYTLVNERELKSISELKTPNQVVAIVKIQSQSINDSSFYLALDGIQDPGNLGTIIRLADWFGLKDIICSKDCVDVYNSKVIQATMGSFFRVNLHYINLSEFIQEKKLPVYGALLNGENIYQQSLQREGILIMGNEGNGIREEILQSVTNPIMIPRFGEAESLNVGIATSIILSEFFRTIY